MEQTPHNQALLDWLRPVDEAEPLLDPDQRIVDPHHHLWNVDDPLALRVASRPQAKWQTRYLADDLLADIAGSGHKVEKTVFLEADAFYQHDAEPPLRPVGETTQVQRIHDAVAGPTEIAAGVVGFVDLSLDTATVRRVLEAHIAACPNFRGIRFANAHDYPIPAVAQLFRLMRRWGAEAAGGDGPDARHLEPPQPPVGGSRDCEGRAGLHLHPQPHRRPAALARRLGGRAGAGRRRVA